MELVPVTVKHLQKINKQKKQRICQQGNKFHSYILLNGKKMRMKRSVCALVQTCFLMVINGKPQRWVLNQFAFNKDVWMC